MMAMEQKDSEETSKEKSWRLEVPHCDMLYVMITSGALRVGGTDGGITFDEFVRLFVWLGRPVQPVAADSAMPLPAKDAIERAFVEHFNPKDSTVTGVLGWTPNKAFRWVGFASPGGISSALLHQGKGSAVGFAQVCFCSHKTHYHCNFSQTFVECVVLEDASVMVSLSTILLYQRASDITIEDASPEVRARFSQLKGGPFRPPLNPPHHTKS